MKFESVTLQRVFPNAYQLTLWSDGVVRWDGEGSIRPGAWQATIEHGWLQIVMDLATSLPASSKSEGGTGGSLIIETSKRRRIHPLSGAAEPAAVWELAMVLDGLSSHLLWIPLDSLGEADFSPWMSGTLLFFRQGVIAGSALALPEGVLLLAGSTASTATAPTLEANYKAMRELLINDGGLQLIGNAFVLTRHLLFSSPSAPACVLAGSNTNGRRAWRDSGGRSWAEIHSD